MRKQTVDFCEVLQAVNEGNALHPGRVKARDMRRRVWVAEWHVPGCLSESFSVHTRKCDALDAALEMCGHVRGARADLMKWGRTDRVAPDAYVDVAITTIERAQVSQLF